MTEAHLAAPAAVDWMREPLRPFATPSSAGFSAGLANYSPCSKLAGACWSVSGLASTSQSALVENRAG